MEHKESCEEWRTSMEKDENNAQILEKSYQNLLKSEKTVKGVYTQVGSDFKKVGDSEVYSIKLKEIFHETSRCFNTIGNEQQKHVKYKSAFKYNKKRKIFPKNYASL